MAMAELPANGDGGGVPLEAVTPALETQAVLQAAEPLSPLLTADYLEHHAVLPLGFEDGRLTVATWSDTIDPVALDDLRSSRARRWTSCACRRPSCAPPSVASTRPTR